jgi:hypothetical protein
MESWRGRGRRAGRDALSRLRPGLGAGGLAPSDAAGLGIAGAVVAVPIVAVITRTVPELRRRDPGPDDP